VNRNKIAVIAVLAILVFIISRSPVGNNRLIKLFLVFLTEHIDTIQSATIKDV
jgi:hypothetical protein